MTLSVCPACGIMTGDSVRKELEDKIKIVKIPKVQSNRRNSLTVEKPSSSIKLNPPPSPVLSKTEVKPATAEIASKRTNRTLLEFQSKDGTVPEWRTQLRNAVRQRKMQKATELDSQIAEAPSITRTPVSDDEFFDNAEIIEGKMSDLPEDHFLMKALKRIEESRDKYHVEESGSFGVATRSTDPARRLVDIKLPKNEEEATAEKSSVNFPAKPVYTPNVDLYDTSELNPKFEPARVSSSFRKASATGRAKIETKVTHSAVEKEPPVETSAQTDTVVSYEDDRAPFAYRFNAGLFDILTTSFASMVLLAPFMLLGGSWFTISGLFAFLATCTIVNFIYLTTTIGLFGKSFGMHLFSLEMIDGQGEEYPSFHQAAVSASVFLLSCAFGGLGFLTCFWDDEQRAIHDIVSNTLIVREL